MPGNKRKQVLRISLGQCRKMMNFDEAKKCEKALFYAGFQHFAIHSNLLNYTRLTTVNPLRFFI